MEKQQHEEDGMNAIADIVAKAFTEIKEDMDRIVNSGDVQSPAGTPSAHAAGASEEQLPAVQLGHGRTFSESPGYDDIELPDLEYRIPEALQSVEVPSPGSTPAAASSAAEGYGICVRRTYATNATGSREPSFNLRQQQYAGSQGSPIALAAYGPCSEFEVDSLPGAEEDPCVEMANTQGTTALLAAASPAHANNKQIDRVSTASGFSPSSGGTAGHPASDKWLQDAAAAAATDAAGAPPVATSHLTYTELLERAIAGMDPKLQQMSNNLLTRTSSRTSVERRRASGESASRRSSGSNSGGGSAARSSSCGRASARPASAGAVPYDGGFGQQTPGLMSVRPWQVQSKFPASSAGATRGPVRRSSARAAAEEDGDGTSVRIFKQGSGSAKKLLGGVDERGVSGDGAAAGQRGASVRSSMDSQVSAQMVSRVVRLDFVRLCGIACSCTASYNLLTGCPPSSA
jgi:hypothetical protein